MRKILFTLALILPSIGEASAAVLTFEERPFTEVQARAAWADFIASQEPIEMVGGSPASSLTAVVRSSSDTWTVTQMHDRGWCGMNTCSTRVFRNGEVWLSTDLCMRGTEDGGTPWQLDPISKTLSACGNTMKLSLIEFTPTTFKDGTFIPAPGWADTVRLQNATYMPDSSNASTSLASVTSDIFPGEPFDHNGSRMRIDHENGIIVYAEPKKSIRKAVKPGTILFRGDISTPNHVSGTAFTFKAGCAPAPYPVSGKFAGGQMSGTLTLKGKAPVRAKSGCGVTAYSANSGNAKLVFEYKAPPDL